MKRFIILVALLFATSAFAGPSISPKGYPKNPAFYNVTVNQTLKTHQGMDVASATAVTLGDGNYFDITGTTTIATIATKAIGTQITLQFDDALTLTHSAHLFLPTAANITTAAGDIAVFYEYAAGDWRCLSYERASGESLIGTVSDTAYNVTSWDNVTTVGGSKNALRDKFFTVDAALDVRCLESVFGTAIGAGLVLDTATLKASTGLQSLSGLTLTAGDMAIATGANAWNVLDNGTAGYLFQANGANNPVWTNTPTLGTPASGTLTSCTGLPQAGIVPGTAENDFLVAGSTPFSFAKKTLADTKTLLHAAPGEIGGTTPAAGSFTTVTTDASAEPYVLGVDSNQTDPDTTWKIYGDATATGTGAEVADMHFQTQGGQGTAGTLQSFLQWVGATESLKLLSGSFFVPEIVTAADMATFGAFYTKDDNKPYFKDGNNDHHEIATTSSYYASMYLNDNGTATIIDTQGYPVLITDFTVNTLSGWTFDAGRVVENDIDQETDQTQLGITTNADHNLTSGDVVSHTGMNAAAHNGVTRVTVTGAKTYTCDDIVYDSAAGASTGIVVEGSHLIAGTGAAGIYDIDWHTSSVSTGTKLYKGQVIRANGSTLTECLTCIGQRKLALGNQGAIPGGSIATIEDGDKLYLSITCTDGTDDLTNQYGNFKLHRL